MDLNKCIPPDSVIIFYIPTDMNDKYIVGKLISRFENYKYCIKNIENNDLYYISYNPRWEIMYSIKVGYYVITDLLIKNNKILKNKFFMYGCTILEGKIVYVDDDICTIETPYGDNSYTVKIDNKWKTIYPDELGMTLIQKREIEYTKDFVELINEDDMVIDS